MAAEAEAAREARAKVIAAEGEHKSSRALAQAAAVIASSPAALQVLNHISHEFIFDRLNISLTKLVAIFANIEQHFC